MSKKKKIGKVISARMQKTRIVSVDRKVKHRFYKKIITQTKRYVVEDQLNAKLGDLVEIRETLPISKTKH